MNRRLRRFIPAYVALLLALAALGAVNQDRLARRTDLIERKEALRLEVVGLRAEAAAVQGPLAVSGWAQAQGMVPAPEAESTRHLLSVPAPSPAGAAEGLEVRTIWR